MAGIRRKLRDILLGRPEGLRAGVRRTARVVCGWRKERSSPAERAAAPVAAPAAEPATPAVPPGFEDVLGADELPPGGLVEVIAGGRTIALGNVDGRIVALTGACPHAGGPLADGYLDGGTLTCPLHGWTFDVETGACHVDPEVSLELWDVRLIGGRVCVQIEV